MNGQNVPVFDIGLVQAGAISAGAYTAGVVDFLIEALDAWEAHRGECGVPHHRVHLKVISGASAGAMTAAISAVALHSDTEPVHWGFDTPAPERNRLYNAWVRQVSIDRLLGTGDLGNGRPVRSLLDSRALGRIARQALRTRPRSQPRAYVADPLSVVLTVANLRGVRYGFAVYRDGNYVMRNHMDQMRFLIGSDSSGGADPAYLDPQTLFDEPERLPANWQRFADAALASGAFPIGLAARHLTRPAHDYDTDVAIGVHAAAEWGSEVPNRFSFIAVDGGLMNNEPLELAREVLRQDAPVHPDNQYGLVTTRALILIDPFPNVACTEEHYDGDDRLIQVAAAMFSALKNQARFHPDELACAADDTVFSRFAITPCRRDEAGNIAIPAMCSACLSGFGGFLKEAFREFDFHLGRRNCQDFLSRYFHLPQENELFSCDLGREREDFYLRSEDGQVVMREIGKPKGMAGDTPTDAARHKMLPILPLMTSVQHPVELPPFPEGLTSAEWSEITRMIHERVTALGNACINTELPRVLGHGTWAHCETWFLALLWRWFLARSIAERLIGAVRVSVLH